MKKLLFVLFAVFVILFSLNTSSVKALGACSLSNVSASPSYISGYNVANVTISWSSSFCLDQTVTYGPSWNTWTTSGNGSHSHTFTNVPPDTFSIVGDCDDVNGGPGCTSDGGVVNRQKTATGVAGTGGTISPPSITTYNLLDSTPQSFTVTPNTGYSIYSVSGCNAGSLSGNTYNFNLMDNCTVSASFTFTPVPVNGACDSTTDNGKNLYSTPTNLCSAGTAGTVTTTATGWTWPCNGSGGGTNASCSANKKVDCVGSWSTCSNGSQTFTVTTPAQNGGTACEATNGQTRPCGTTAECAPTHYNCSVGTYAGDGTGGATGPWNWTCLGLNGGANIGCGESASPVVPTVSTGAASSITSNSASATGTISSNGGSTVTVSGCAWNTTGSPTTANSKTTNGWSIGGPYSCSLTGLSPGTTYYVRAYATNGVGTAYGNQISFATTAAMSGTITPSASACTIVLGGNSCTVNLSWNTVNPVATSAVTSPYPVANTTVGSGNSGTANGVIIPYNGGNGRDFYLYNNAQQLAFQNITANCGSNTWNGSMCTTGGAPLVNGACSSPQAHYTCSAGTSINNVDGASTWTWSCQGSGGGSTASCSENKPVQPAPNLTAENPTPTTAVRNSTTTLSSRIFNIGNASTGASFSNFFQVATGAGGTGNITDLASTTTPTLNFGANAPITQTYPFPSVGTYSIRACADKVNKDGGGVIGESNEGDNCSDWVNVTVSSTGAGTWSAWSDCINGVKTRTCTPVNTCSGASSMACSTPKIKEN